MIHVNDVGSMIPRIRIARGGLVVVERAGSMFEKEAITQAAGARTSLQPECKRVCERRSLRLEYDKIEAAFTVVKGEIACVACASTFTDIAEFGVLFVDA